MPKEAVPAFSRGVFPFPIFLTGFLNQSGAVTLVEDFNPGFTFSVEKVTYIPEVAGAGAGATQGISVRKGGATGTILATATVTLANHVLGGAGVSGSVPAANEADARVRDTDTISITKAAGTVFSTGGGTLLVYYRSKPQARL